MAMQTWTLAPELQAYVRKHGVRESSAAQALCLTTANLPGAVMQIAPEQGQLLGFLLRLMGARTVLEIGTFTGYSALVMAEHLPADGQVISCELDPASAKIAQHAWQEASLAANIELRLGRAIDTLNTLLVDLGDASFDAMFIDADKANYDTYYELGLRLVRAGGLIAIDNVLWHGKVVDPAINDKQTQAIRALNAKIIKDQRVEPVMVPVGDGMTLLRKRTVIR